MERNTVTIVYNLQIGDRFYKVNDKKKVVYEKIEHKTRQTFFRTYKHFMVLGSIADKLKAANGKFDYERFVEIIQAETKVIFLRHAN